MQFNTIVLASLLSMGSAACFANSTSNSSPSNSSKEPVALNSSENSQQRHIQQQGNKK